MNRHVSSIRSGDPAYIAAILAFAVLCVYSNSFHNSFHFDDFAQVSENTNIRSISNVPRFFVDPGIESYLKLKGYRPLTLVSYTLNHALTGPGAWGFHLGNVALHILNALLLFFVVSGVIKAEGTGRDAGYLPLLASLVFALHPVQTSAVTYISGRSALLVSFFCLSSFLCFIRYRLGGPRAMYYAALSPLLFLMGLFSKDNAITLIALILAYDFLFVSPGQALQHPKRRLVVYAPFLAAAAIFLAVKSLLLGYVGAPRPAFGTGVYLMSEAKALLIYLRLMLIPVNQNFDYHIPATTSVDVPVVISAVLIAIALVWMYRHRKTDRVLVFFGLWIFITLVPESTFVPLPDIVVLYRLYLPSAGLIAAAVIFTARTFRPTPAFAKAFAVSVLLMFGALSYGRNFVYADEFTLWGDVARKAPYSARAHAFYADGLDKAGRYSEAGSEYLLAVRLDPAFAECGSVYNDLGVRLLEKGDYDEAVELFTQAVRTEPGFVNAYTNLGAAYHRMGRYRDAAREFLKALGKDPLCGQAHFNLALSYTELGMHREALSEITKASGLVQQDFELYYNLAIIHNNNGMKQEALRYARESRGYASDDAQRDEAASIIKTLGG